MKTMTRTSWMVSAVVAVLAAAIPAIALANDYELGTTKSPLVAPTCPPTLPSSQCTIILTRVTALETLRDGTTYPTTIKTSGRIVAFTVGLSALSSNATTRKTYIHYLDQAYGGTAQVALTVLRPVGKRTNWQWQTVATSPIYRVESYLGNVIQIPLDSSIEVKPGEVIALTTPTWAPVLTIAVDNKRFAYRQSRKANCNNPPGLTQAQFTMGQTTTYGCNYPGTRVEYSASEISYPFGTNPVHTTVGGPTSGTGTGTSGTGTGTSGTSGTGTSGGGTKG